MHHAACWIIEYFHPLLPSLNQAFHTIFPFIPFYSANVPSIPTPNPSFHAPSLKTTNTKNFNVLNEFFTKIIQTTSFIILLNCYLLKPLCNDSSLVPFNILRNTIRKKIQHPIDIFVLLNILTAWLSIILVDSMKPNELLHFSMNVIKIDIPSINVYHLSRSIKKYSFDLSSLAFFVSSYSWTGHISCIKIVFTKIIKNMAIGKKTNSQITWLQACW